MEPTTVFFRDDDVGARVEPLARVAELLLEAEIPCSYQVVPTLLSDDTARFARELKRSSPGLVFLNQHGLRHEQRLGGERVWSEFAGGRSYDAQHADIAAGRRLLEERLGPELDADVFTPPCHKYDAQTLRALAALGFTVLSAGVRTDRLSRLYYAAGRALGRVSLLGARVSYHGAATPVAGLAEVSCCIDVDEDQDAAGNKLVKDAERLGAEFAAARAVLPVVGVMLHHERYQEPGRLETLRRFVAALREDPAVRFAPLPAIAAALP